MTKSTINSYSTELVLDDILKKNEIVENIQIKTKSNKKPTYKLDIFEVIKRIRSNDKQYFSNLSTEQKKGFVPRVVFRWLTGNNSDILSLNELNHLIDPLYKYPKLMYDLLCDHTKETNKYVEWKPVLGKKSDKEIIALIKDCFDYNTKHAEDVQYLFSDEDLIKMAQGQGWPKKDFTSKSPKKSINSLKKELKNRILPDLSIRKTPKAVTYPYQCKYCESRFKKETNFLNHNCKEMKRHELLKTIVGEQSWLYYSDWIKLKNKQVSSRDAFIVSKYFNAFIRFTEFIKKNNIHDANRYIKYMVSSNYHPPMWTMNETLEKYNLSLDNNLSAIEHVKITVETLYELADMYECNISEIFEYIPTCEIIHLIRQKKLSGWFLTLSTKFVTKYKKICTKEEHSILFNVLLSGNIWQEKFSKEKKNTINKIVNLVIELNL